MFVIIVGLLIALAFTVFGVRMVRNATAMARRHQEGIALWALTEGMPVTSRFAWPPVLFRCIGVLSALAGTAAALFAVAALIVAV
ncbi:MULTISPECIES: hypothetical protein [unclassified Streptomyces]|uniref:hypothetical protein n=1 Tax=unclassified Streptomyces TaxID=2593676 RepID=UPI00093B382C|nr:MULTISPECIES: hypothetical protein [unclassified Streptomyces]NEC06796.1 hypothetical protein [Streptomyces sp. SID7909]OKJ02828.1 hypothetical protein AMK18_13665 [Streptomyces sp. CB01249]